MGWSREGRGEPEVDSGCCVEPCGGVVAEVHVCGAEVVEQLVEAACADDEINNQGSAACPEALALKH